MARGCGNDPGPSCSAITDGEWQALRILGSEIHLTGCGELCPWGLSVKQALGFAPTLVKQAEALVSILTAGTVGGGFRAERPLAFHRCARGFHLGEGGGGVGRWSQAGMQLSPFY